MRTVGTLAPLSSRDELDRALLDLAQLAAVEASLEADCAVECARIKDRFQALMVVRDAAGQASFADRRAELEGLIIDYCAEHRAELLPAGRKSLELTHGVVGWRLGKASVRVEGGPAWSKLVDGLVAAVRKALGKLAGLVATAKADEFFTVAVNPDKRAILAAYDAGTLKPRRCAQLGLQILPAEERFYIEPAKVTVRTEQGVAE